MKTIKNKCVEDVPFDLFVAIWNGVQGLETPAVHIKIARWLDDNWRQGNKHLLLMAFRACCKSTLVGLFCAWLLFLNPNLRILVLAADLNLSRKMVRNVKKIIERNPLTNMLKPDNPDQWATDLFTVKRSKEMRDPSMLARSITANMTGSRADIIICDDVEVPTSCETADKRRFLREVLAEIDYVLVPGGVQLYVGTPHHYFSIYADQPRVELDEERIFLEGFKRLVLPILTPNGESVWPERFPLSEIERIRKHTGPNKFSSQMMLRPISIANGRLNPDDLVFYGDELEESISVERLWLKLRGKKLVSASCWWDPSFRAGDKGGDASVVAAVFTDEEGQRYLHAIEYLSYDAQSNEDEATQQCRQIDVFLKRFNLPSVTVEINGIGRFLPSLLRKVLVQQKNGASVVEASNFRAKETRILESFDALLAARGLMVHERVKKTAFIQEMKEWRPEIKGKNCDDGLDAVAGALSLEPIRIHHGWLKRAQQKQGDWRGSGVGFSAETDFSV